MIAVQVRILSGTRASHEAEEKDDHSEDPDLASRAAPLVLELSGMR